MAAARFIALIIWVIGVQTHELIGTIGLALLVATFLPDVTKLTRASLIAWWPLLAFIAWSLLGPLLGGNRPDGAGLARTLDWLSIPLVAIAVSSLSDRQRTRVVIAAVSTLVVSSFVAGLQHFGVWPAETAFVGLEWMRIPFTRVYERIGEDGTRFMGGGLLFHRLKFSHVSGLVLVLSVFAAARTKSKMLIVASAFAFIAVWLFPYARMGAVAATVGVAAVIVLVAPSRKNALLASAALALIGAIAVFAVEPLRARFVSGLTDQGSGQRTQHLAAGLEAIQQHPFVGVGAGQFRPSKFAGPEMAEHVKDNPGKAHNQFVSIAAETGLIGGALFIALLIWLGVKARRAEFGVLTLAAIAQFVVLSLVHDPLFQAPYSMGLVLLLGSGLAQLSSQKPGADSIG